MPLEVMEKQCGTCIYRVNSPLDLAELEAQVADPHMAGFFSGFRICHHHGSACCRGFWNKHKDHFALGQVAQRLKVVAFVGEKLEQDPDTLFDHFHRDDDLEETIPKIPPPTWDAT